MPRKFYQHKGLFRKEDVGDFLRALHQDAASGFATDLTSEMLDTIADRHPHRRIYSEREIEYIRQIAAIEGLLREDDWIVYELGQHKITDSIPTFEGWTPHFAFNESGFDLARRLELINLWQGQIPLEEGERVRLYAYHYAGSQEVFEQKRAKIEATFNELDRRGIEFIVFRTFSRYPNFWDTLYFYSLGRFREGLESNYYIE